MDQQLNNRRIELLWELLANPANKGGEHAYNLHQLLNDYPQSNLLQALLVYVGDEESLQHAAAYTNPRLLYKLAYNSDGLAVVDSNQIIDLNHLPADEYSRNIQAEENFRPVYNYHNDVIVPVNDVHSEEHLLVPHEDTIEAEAEPEEPTETKNEEAVAVQNDQEILTEGITPEEEPEIPADELLLPEYSEDTTDNFEQNEPPVVISEPQEELQPVEQDEAPEAAHHPEEVKVSAEDIWEEYLKSTLPATEETEEDNTPQIIEPLITLEEKEPQIAHQIEDEVYDEIQSIEEINRNTDYQEDEVYDEIQSIEEINRNTEYRAHESTNTQAHESKDVAQQQDTPVSGERKPRFKEEEKLILGNIAATDFFVFDRAFKDKSQVKATEPSQLQEYTNDDKEKKVVSKYNDDKMPYSFMWWLDKTRKEHAGIYQPYVNFTLDTTQSIKSSAPDELQQQYYENIFHITSVEELDRSTGQQPVEYDPKRKEDSIIERFIQEVPQIKPLSGDKLDNENKAKKSSEDANEIVTETLAHIYADQMLYHKAITTYKKLMLKFPEKSRYFASQIEELEKKTN